MIMIASMIDGASSLGGLIAIGWIFGSNVIGSYETDQTLEDSNY